MRRRHLQMQMQMAARSRGVWSAICGVGRGSSMERKEERERVGLVSPKPKISFFLEQLASLFFATRRQKTRVGLTGKEEQAQRGSNQRLLHLGSPFPSPFFFLFLHVVSTCSRWDGIRKWGLFRILLEGKGRIVETATGLLTRLQKHSQAKTRDKYSLG